MSTTDFLICKILTKDKYKYACMSKEKNYKKTGHCLHYYKVENIYLGTIVIITKYRDIEFYSYFHSIKLNIYH